MQKFFLKYYNEWVQYSLKDKVETIALFVAVVGAIITYFEYKTQHDLSVGSQLRESDRHINSMILEYPAMDGIWLTVSDDLHGKDRANALLLAVIKNKSNDTRKILTEWKHIGDLESILWSGENFYNEDFVRLRQVYMLAEEILYLVVEVLDLEEKGRISPADTKSYVAYIKDLGAHPLFLHAIWFGHRNGYFPPNVAIRLQNELKKNEEAEALAGVIYKEILSPDWANKMNR